MKLSACVACGLVLLGGRASFAKQPAPGKSKNPDVLQFRLVEDKEGPDTVAMKLKGKDETLHVNKQVLLNALDVESARATHDAVRGTPNISLNFTRDGAKKFAEVTAKNVNRKLAIIVDGQLLSAPIIRTAIEGGKAIIEGDFKLKEAQELVHAINGSAAE